MRLGANKIGHFLKALACLSGAFGAATVPARAASDVTMAVIAIGRLYVVGTTDKPNTSVVLDQKFASISDDRGNFAFEEVYYPTNCVVGVEINARIYRAVVSNCAQQGRAGAAPPPHAVAATGNATKLTAPAAAFQPNRVSAKPGTPSVAKTSSSKTSSDKTSGHGTKRSPEEIGPARAISRRRQPATDEGPFPRSGSSDPVE